MGAPELFPVVRDTNHNRKGHHVRKDHFRNRHRPGHRLRHHTVMVVDASVGALLIVQGYIASIGLLAYLLGKHQGRP